MTVCLCFSPVSVNNKFTGEWLPGITTVCPFTKMTSNIIRWWNCKLNKSKIKLSDVLTIATFYVFKWIFSWYVTCETSLVCGLYSSVLGWLFPIIKVVWYLSSINVMILLLLCFLNFKPQWTFLTSIQFFIADSDLNVPRDTTTWASGPGYF